MHTKIAPALSNLLSYYVFVYYQSKVFVNGSAFERSYRFILSIQVTQTYQQSQGRLEGKKMNFWFS